MADTRTSVCVRCGTPARKYCSGCKDAVEVDGNPSHTKTSYCSKECQTEDWKVHKEACRPGNLWRKQLYRACHFLQAVFYVLRETAFDTPIANVGVEPSGKIHVFQGVSSDDQVLAPVPDDWGFNEQEKKTVLAYRADAEVLVNMLNLVVKAMDSQSLRSVECPSPPSLTKGNADIGKITELIEVPAPGKSRVAFHRLAVQGEGTALMHGKPDESEHYFSLFKMYLKDGNVYAIDLAGAQFGRHRPIMPWEEYEANHASPKLSEAEVGTARKRRQRALNGQLNDGVDPQADLRVPLVQARIAKCMDATVDLWERLMSSAGEKITVAQMLGKNKRQYALLQQELLEVIERAIKQYVGKIEKRGGWKFAVSGDPQ